MLSMNVHVETVKLGSRNIFLYVWFVWLVVATGFAFGISDASSPILSRFGMGFILCLVTIFWTNFSYGEVSDGGVRYRRIWGWKAVRWYEIDNFHRNGITGGISVTLRYLPKPLGTLYFAGRLSSSITGRKVDDLVASIEQFDMVCKAWRKHEDALPDVL
jgi:hypothetical protein